MYGECASNFLNSSFTWCSPVTASIQTWGKLSVQQFLHRFSWYSWTWCFLNGVTDNVNCCNNTDVGGWRDESGRPVYQGADGTTCLYVTKGDGVISLHRKRGCRDPTSRTVEMWYTWFQWRDAEPLHLHQQYKITWWVTIPCMLPFYTPNCRTAGLRLYAHITIKDHMVSSIFTTLLLLYSTMFTFYYIKMQDIIN